VHNREMVHVEECADCAYIAGTLVMPSNMPSLTSEPQRRLRMEVQRVVKRFKDLVTVISYKWTQTPRLKIHFFKTAATAQALHRQMYTALAEYVVRSYVFSIFY